MFINYDAENRIQNLQKRLKKCLQIMHISTEIKDKSLTRRMGLNSSISTFKKLLGKINTAKLKSAKEQLEGV
ncbi:MAG: hypothetical protein Q8P62_05380 [Candidatus Peregrinibacteria bacterium]|nr:hypothetical protein [Candidatus Peregrinibacteria bacterium]